MGTIKKLITESRTAISKTLESIAGVQPMTGNVGGVFTLRPKMLPKYRVIDSFTLMPPNGYLVVEVNFEVARWIEEQPLYMWKPVDGEPTVLVQPTPVMVECFYISDDLYTWMTLRWA
jgi:hypothetical protein